MIIFDVTNPITLLLLLAATVLLIFLGKEIKNPLPPAIALFLFLVLIVIHCIQFGMLTQENIEINRPILLGCLGIDGIMILTTFLGYLWIDDISAKFYKKKSIDNSLDWFWGKI